MAHNDDGFRAVGALPISATAKYIGSVIVATGTSVAAEIVAITGLPRSTVYRCMVEFFANGGDSLIRLTRPTSENPTCPTDGNCDEKTVSLVPPVRQTTPENSHAHASIASRATNELPSEVTLNEDINTPQPPTLKTKREGPTPLQALKAFEAYNAKALELGLPQAAKLTPDRSRKIIARLRDYGLDGWQRALENIGRSKFLMGETPQNFRADLDFLCQAKSLGKLHDGGYGSDRKTKSQQAAAAAPFRRMTDEEKFEQSLPWLKQMGLISDELAN